MLRRSRKARALVREARNVLARTAASSGTLQDYMDQGLQAFLVLLAGHIERPYADMLRFSELTRGQKNIFVAHSFVKINNETKGSVHITGDWRDAPAATVVISVVNDEAEFDDLLTHSLLPKENIETGAARLGKACVAALAPRLKAIETGRKTLRHTKRR